jgi:signal transduction histidine kinase
LTDTELTLVATLRHLIDKAIEGQIVALPQVDRDVEPDLLALAESVGNLLVNIDTMRRFSVALANGEIATEAPLRNKLLGPLKSLQASLRHLTWQTKEVAAGHLDHRVDFLGEFSTAFNQMIDALRMKKRVEHEAMETSRLVGIGQLAAGIAHEINTPLQYIDINLEFIQEGLKKLRTILDTSSVLANQAQAMPELADTVASLRENISQLEEDCPLEEMNKALADTLIGTARISRIVTAVKDFTAVRGSARGSANINSIIETTLEVSRNTWSHVAECILELDPSLPPVLCWADDIKQALLNLVLNATQAIEECGKPAPGRITVNTCREGNHIVIRIADNGPGIPAAIRNKIFNLFYTTRDIGKGTGLGLAMVHDVIVTKHFGIIEVGGNESEGAVFTIRLPISACS